MDGCVGVWCCVFFFCLILIDIANVDFCYNFNFLWYHIHTEIFFKEKSN